MPWKFERVTSSTIILGEGRDEAELLEAMAQAMGLQVQCVDCGGSQQFHIRLKVVMAAPGFDRVTSLGVVRDAETNSAAAEESIRGRLAAEGLAVPDKPMTRATAPDSPDVAFLVVPSGEPAGMMEDLILRAMKDDPSWKCQQAYFDCLALTGIDLTSDPQKRRVQAALAALPSGNLARNIGEAARKGLIPFGHPGLSELSDFLTLVT